MIGSSILNHPNIQAASSVLVTLIIARMLMHRIICSLILIIVYSHTLSAQQFQPDNSKGTEYIDSLKIVLESTSDNQSLTELYLKIGLAYEASAPDSSIAYYHKILPITDDLWDISLAYLNLGYGYFVINDYGNSLVYYNKAQRIVESAKVLNYIDGTKEEKRVKQQLHLADLLRLKGLLYGAIGNHKESFDSYMIALQIVEQQQDTSSLVLGWVYGNIADYYHFVDEQIEKSIRYAEKCINIISDYTNGQLWVPYYMTVQGHNYLKLKQYEKALEYLNQGVSLGKLEYNNAAVGIGLWGLAETHLALGEIEKSYKYAQETYAHGENNNYQRMSASEILAKIHKSKGAMDSAFYYMQEFATLKDSINTLHLNNLTNYQNVLSAENERLQALEDQKIAFRNNLRFGLLFAGLSLVALLAWIFNRNARKERKANEQINKAYSDLKSTQTQLIQSEKMASLGELTAGIAHEIQNPLNFVNNFSEVSGELIDEALEEIDTDPDEAKDILSDLKTNLEKINHHGKRADSIVKGMLQHSRSDTGEKVPTDINALCDEYMRLAYHGLRAKNQSFNANYKLNLDNNLAKINVVPQDISRVILNIITNAFQACIEKSQNSSDTTYAPKVTCSTLSNKGQVIIKITDNGNGIPDDIKEKIFQPFFTTKPTGQGTGLGLSMAYDIIKAHGGELTVESAEGEGSEFRIVLPL